MRWYWIDRFIEFESGKRARTVKNVSLAEEHLHDHFFGHPVMPNSLIIEGFAQTGGILVGEHIKFSGNMILAKVPKAAFHDLARPGDTLTYTSTIDAIEGDGAMVSGVGHIGDRLFCEVDIVFANVVEGDKARRLFSSQELVAMLMLLGVYDVGVDANGNRLAPPDPEQLALK